MLGINAGLLSPATKSILYAIKWSQRWNRMKISSGSNVATASVCVSPRVKITDPGALDETSGSMVIGRMSLRPPSSCSTLLCSIAFRIRPAHTVFQAIGNKVILSSLASRSEKNSFDDGDKVVNTRSLITRTATSRSFSKSHQEPCTIHLYTIRFLSQALETPVSPD